jgi:hypothetical protein
VGVLDHDQQDSSLTEADHQAQQQLGQPSLGRTRQSLDGCIIAHPRHAGQQAAQRVWRSLVASLDALPSCPAESPGNHVTGANGTPTWPQPTQPPILTRTPPARIRMASFSIIRDMPTPASPATNTTEGPATTVPSTATDRRSNSARRPTKVGHVELDVWPAAGLLQRRDSRPPKPTVGTALILERLYVPSPIHSVGVGPISAHPWRPPLARQPRKKGDPP